MTADDGDGMLDHPHRRFNALTGDWVLVSAGRTGRPWLGAEEPPPPARRPRFDPECHLCPGNRRSGGQVNDRYQGTYVFTNDFSALRPDTPAGHWSDGLLVAETVPGVCRVICYSPRHDLDLATMNDGEIRTVVDLWADQERELAVDHRWVQIFENRGAAAGASNPHPHGQVWAGAALPVEAAKEAGTQRDHHERYGSALLVDYLSRELETGERVVSRRGNWAALVPFWAVWPFETLIVTGERARTIADLDDGARRDLARLLGDLLRRYDRVFDRPFPYSMGWHSAPAPADDHPGWQLHAHLYPPLLRSASVRKFMVGYELLAEPQRDLTAEEAAARLRALGDEAPPDA